MEYTKRIRIYKVILEMTMPLMELPEIKSVKLNVDDNIVCIDDDVWIVNPDNDEPDERSLAVVGKKFIVINPELFQPL